MGVRDSKMKLLSRRSASDRIIKRILAFILALFMVAGIGAFYPSKGVEAKGSKYKLMSFYDNVNQRDKSYVKVGNYFVRRVGNYSNGFEYQVRKGKNGTYKNTTIKRTKRGKIFVSNGQYIYYVDDNGNIMRYTFASNKTKKVGKVPDIETDTAKMVSKRNNGHKRCNCEADIVAVNGKYIYINSWNSEWFDYENMVMYSYDMNTKKIKYAGLSGVGTGSQSGQYYISRDMARGDFAPVGLTVYKFTSSGKIKRVKQLSKGMYHHEIYKGKIYWIDEFYSPEGRKKSNVFYCAKINGKGKKVISKSSTLNGYYVNEQDSTGIILTNWMSQTAPQKIYKFKTKKIVNR